MKGSVCVCLVVAGLFLCPLTLVQAQPLPEAIITTVEAILDEENLPGAGLAIVDADGRTFSGGVGFADLENQIPVGADTRFHGGSIAKTFLALGMGVAEFEGLLDMDAKVKDFAPTLPLNNPWADAAPVTLRHLLEHTAGFDDFHLGESLSSGPIPPNRPLEEVLQGHPETRDVRFKPGSAFSYSNTGYTTAAYILEQATGSRYEDYLNLKVVGPLALTQTSLDIDWTPAPDLSVHYRGAENVPVDPFQTLHRAPGNLTTSANDLLSFAKVFINRGQVDGRQAVPAAVIDDLLRPETNLPVLENLDFAYSPGNFPTMRHGTPMYGHDGGIIGAQSSFAFHREKGLGYAILINKISPSAMNRIKQVLFDFLNGGPVILQTERVLAPANLEIFSGHYRVITFRPALLGPVVDLLERVDILAEEDALYLKPFMGDTERLIPSGGNTFRVQGRDRAEYAFIETGDGGMTLVSARERFEEAEKAFWILKLSGLAIILVLVLLTVPYGLILVIKRVFKKRKPSGFQTLTVVSGLSAVVTLFGAAGINIYNIYTANGTTMTLAYGSLAFAALTLAAAVFLGKIIRQRKKLPKFATLLFAGNLAFVVTLAAWGFLGLQTWSY